jgi:molybdopterin synthase catalytic subunit
VAHVTTGISPEPLDVTGAIADASAPSCGAVASFIGTVRESASVRDNAEKSVTTLEYEAHPTLAPARMDEVAHEAAAKWPLERVVAIHRTGTCELGEPTVVIACGSAHRGDALDACHWMIDEIKATVPIWKKEIYADGSSWVGAEGE